MAGINALCATLEFTGVPECATRVLPALCTVTVDPDKSVRDHVSKGVLFRSTRCHETPRHYYAHFNVAIIGAEVNIGY